MPLGMTTTLVVTIAMGATQERRSHAKRFGSTDRTPSYGNGIEGIYTRFRRGPFEVFLLDTRSFAATEPSPYESHAASLLGRQQWDWLRAGLKDSTAPYKLLACGMIWNGAVRPGKRDHWGSYAHERDALFEFIGKKGITGVALIGGDIHRSRVIRHDSEALAEYPILEFISSPIHDRVMEKANQPHPGLVVDLPSPHTFLMFEGTCSAKGESTARAVYVNAAGERLFETALGAGEDH